MSESLDYEPIQNKLFYDRMKSRKEGKKKLYGCVGRSPSALLRQRGPGATALQNLTTPRKPVRRYTGHTMVKMAVTLLTGVLTGFFAVAMTKSVGFFTEWKLEVIKGHMETESSGRIFVSFLLFWLIGSMFVTFAVCLVSLPEPCLPRAVPTSAPTAAPDPHQRLTAKPLDLHRCNTGPLHQRVRA